MDFALNESQQMLQRGAREFLEKECGAAEVRRLEDSAEGFSRDLWRQMADLGWLGLTIPEEFGGLGADLLDQALLCEEIGRALLPGLYLETCVIAPRLLLDAGSEAQQKDLLPSIAAGERLVALAVTEEDAGWDAVDVQLTAKPSGDGYVLDGLKLFVPFAASADLLIVPARGGPGAEDISLFLVERGSAGLTVEDVPSLTANRLGEVRFDSVKVPASALIGEAGKGWAALARALTVGSVMLSAIMTGGSAKVLEISTEYAKSRVAFGSPIGSFQAIQHKLVQMLADVDSSRYAVYESLWKIERDSADLALSVSTTKYKASEGYRDVCFEGHEIHAGVGFMWDYDLQLFYRRAKWFEQYLGHPVLHRERVAVAMGL